MSLGEPGGFWGRVVSTWHAGNHVVGGFGVCGPLGAQLVVAPGLRGPVPSGAGLVVGFAPCHNPPVLSEGLRGVVQSFRCVMPGRAVLVLSFCASCGHVAWSSESAWEGSAGKPCPICGTSQSPLGCRAWHRWGSCLWCPSGAAVDLGGRAASSRSGDRPALDAGPSASSLGSCSLSLDPSAVPP